MVGMGEEVEWKRFGISVAETFHIMDTYRTYWERAVFGKAKNSPTYCKLTRQF
jgi:hypothetical protein